MHPKLEEMIPVLVEVERNTKDVVVSRGGVLNLVEVEEVAPKMV